MVLLEIFLSKLYYFHSFLKILSFQKNISSGFFQYSDKTIASTDTNDTSTERSNTQLFRVGKSKGVHGHLHGVRTIVGLTRDIIVLEWI